MIMREVPLYCPKCRQETLINETTEYYSYQRAGRTDAEPITRKTIPLWLSAFFISIYDDSLPRPTGKEKNVAGQVAFVRSIYIPAAVLKYNSRPPFSAPHTDDALTLAGSAAHGGSRHEAKSVSTEYDEVSCGTMTAT